MKNKYHNAQLDIPLYQRQKKNPEDLILLNIISFINYCALIIWTQLLKVVKLKQNLKYHNG